MIHKERSPLPSHVRIIFELPASIWATQAFLVGDFNGWDEEATPFMQTRSGVWQATIDLPVSHFYEFRYLIDGHWHTDYHADSLSLRGSGSQNSIVSAVLAVEAESHKTETDLGQSRFKNYYTVQHRCIPSNDHVNPLQPLSSCSAQIAA